jgi:hypothetical protein
MRFANSGRRQLELSDFVMPQGGTAGSAAGSGSKVADIYSSLAANAPRADEQAMLAIGERSKLRQGAFVADEGVRSAKKLADAQLEADKELASAAAPESSGGGIGSFIGPALSIGASLLSDATTKHNIEPLEDALATLRHLKPVTFYYNEEYSSSPERLHHGFIAQEYQEVMPDATYYDESIGKLAIDTGDLIAILVSAVKTLESRVSRMEAANALKGLVGI